MGELVIRLQNLEEEVLNLRKELEQKKYTEDILKYNLNILKSLYDSATEAIYLINNDYKILTFNKAAHSFTKSYRNQELQIGDIIFNYMSLEEKALLIQSAQKCFQGQSDNNTIKLSENKWIKFSLTPVYQQDNSILGIAIVVLDMTQSKLTELELQLTQFSVNNVSEAMFWVGPNAQIFKVNQSACSLLGYSKEEFNNMTVFDIDVHIKPEIWDAHWRKLKEVKTINIESNHITKEGKEIQTLNTLNYIEFEGQEYNFVLTKDITELKKAEIEVRQSEKLYKEMVENAPDSIALFDLDTFKFIDCNDNTLKLFKVDKSKFLQLSFADVSTEYQPDGTLSSKKGAENIQRVIKGEKPVLEWIHVDSLGNNIHCEIRLGKITWKGKALGRVSMLDITESKKAERAMQSSLQEKEILLAEIHHRVKNNLAIISSLLRLQFYNIDDEKVKDALRESILRIQTIALVHQKLYRSESLAHISMDDYITDLVMQLSATYLDSRIVDVQIQAEDIALDIIKAIPCGLIINELITNIYKHAFKERVNGIIDICFSKENDVYELLVKDNGVGFTPEFEINAISSMGMQLIKMLTDQLEGELNVFNSEGAHVLIKFK